jgi:hypothetical protein
MRSSFVRNFYLPYHFPPNSTYNSHYRSRKPPELDGQNLCHCSRQLESERLCTSCIASVPLLECIQKGELSEEIVLHFKPYLCKTCNERFTDKNKFDKHIRMHDTVSGIQQIIPQLLSLKELKEKLRLHNKSTSGNKAELIRRLEGFLTKK